MSGRKEYYSLRLTVVMIERLRALSRAHRVPVCAIVRDVLERGLDAWEDSRTPAPEVTRNWLDPTEDP